jgi:hypothetical protein
MYSLKIKIELILGLYYATNLSTKVKILLIGTITNKRTLVRTDSMTATVECLEKHPSSKHRSTLVAKQHTNQTTDRNNGTPLNYSNISKFKPSKLNYERGGWCTGSAPEFNREILARTSVILTEDLRGIPRSFQRQHLDQGMPTSFQDIFQFNFQKSFKILRYIL